MFLNATESANYADILAHVEALEALADKLPRTADGVRITPGMKIYSSDTRVGTAHAELRAHYSDGFSVIAIGWGVYIIPERDCYSTPEAALASLSAANNMKGTP